VRKSTARPINLPHSPKESELHVSVAQLLDWILLPPAIWTTFPAGWGKLGKATAGRLYASGLKKGMPDILVFSRAAVGWPKYSLTNVIGIELKVGDNSVSSAQRTMFAQLQAVGIRVHVCRSIEEVVAALDSAGIDHRGIGRWLHSRDRPQTYEVPYDQGDPI
jgi:hypothetical protein